MSTRRPLPALAVVSLLALSAAAQAEDAFPGWSAALGDLQVRILPGEGQAGDRLVAGVGRPFDVRFELRNRGNDSLLLPLGHPAFVKGTVRYVDPDPAGGIGGRAWGPAPLRESLVEIGPGATRLATLPLTPSSHGPATVRLSLVCLFDQVAERVHVGTPREGGGEAVHLESKLVDEPRLWKGSLVVEAPIDVVFGSHYGEDEGVDPRAVRALWTRDLSLLERLDTLGRVATRDPSSRAVDLLRQGFGRRYDGPAWPLLVRIECAKQLAIAAGKGYGWRGLKTLLAAAQDEAEDESVRLLALEGLALALDERLRATEGDCVFDLRIPPGWRSEATLLFATLADRPSPLGRRAGEIVAARTEGER